MIRKAVFAFSACPVTKGHVDIVRRACKLFDQVIVATVGKVNKGSADEMFPYDDRLNMMGLAFQDIPEVQIGGMITGTTVDFCKRHDTKFLIRGVRDYTDLDYEYKLAYLNRKMSHGEVETFFVPADPMLSVFSSTTVRGLIKLGDPTWREMVPESVAMYIDGKLKLSR